MLKSSQLETFYWASQTGAASITAAVRLCTTQSAVSMRVRELERELRATLFDRGHRSAVITTEGRELLGYAEQNSSTVAAGKERISEKEECAAATFRIGCAEVVSITWLPRLIRALHAKSGKIGGA